MKTLEEVFSYNVKRFRGDRTQAEIAESAGLPLQSYQRAEYGALPHGQNRAAIARALGVGETALFIDPDLPGPSGDTAEFLRKKQELIATLTTLDDAKFRLLLPMLEGALSTLEDSQNNEKAHKIR